MGTTEVGTYYTDPKIRKEIDRVLHENAIIFQNLGVDSTKAEIEAARIQERKNLRDVKALDEDFIGRLLLDSKE